MSLAPHMEIRGVAPLMDQLLLLERIRLSLKFLLPSVSPLGRFNHLFVLLTIITKKESEGKPKMLSLEQKVGGNITMGTLVLGTAV